MEATKTYTWGLGRRKTSTARVRVRGGSGKFEVNDKPLEQYFVNKREQNAFTLPLKTAGLEGKFDIFVNVSGGGIASQAEAASLGIARALCKINLELEPKLKEQNLLTRDGRRKERKKYGRKGARRGFQFSKR
ncbi:MAG: 30S ribosomal protein S9 [Planctomycetes bacterium]|nr:30S ribosomal protein S9 [Planctomycetota bacterium]